MRHPLIGMVIALAGCDLVLGVPNPDEVKDIQMVGTRLCNECDAVVQQGDEVIAACQSGVAEGGEDGLKVLAEADCDVCANASECYGLATGAGEVGSSCASHTECKSCACCVTVLAATFDDSTVALGECCDACIGCGEMYEPQLPWVPFPPLCVEPANPFVPETGEFTPFFALAECLCGGKGVMCVLECPNTPGLDPGDQCIGWLASPECRACLFSISNDACAGELDACNADFGRPR